MSILRVPPLSGSILTPPTSARQLSPQSRQQLACDVFAGQSISSLAQTPQVSRKFVYRQVQQARTALDEAFAPPADAPEQLLFWLPVTRPWLQQLVLGLVLIGHSSLRGVTELLADLFDTSLSLG